MRDLAAIYGRWLTGLIVLLTAAWALGMIVLPQLFVLEQSLWHEEKGQVQVETELARAYSELSLAEFDLEAEEDAAKKPEIEGRIATLKGEVAALEARKTGDTRVYGIENYTRMSELHVRIFARTIAYAALVTLLALVACYPIAYAAARATTAGKGALILLGLTIPYAINELLRIYAWLMILDYQGVVNGILASLGLVAPDAGIPFLEHPASTFAAMVYAYILFMVFPIYNTVETLDQNQIDAARDLGASTWRIHWRVVIPHAKPGLAVGCIMTFMLSAGSYAVPQIMTRGLGGDWFSQTIYRQFFEGQDWNLGAAYSFSLLFVCTLFIFATMAAFRVGIRDIAK